VLVVCLLLLPTNRSFHSAEPTNNHHKTTRLPFLPSPPKKPLSFIRISKFQNFQKFFQKISNPTTEIFKNKGNKKGITE
jgi:hypothetical protein